MNTRQVLTENGTPEHYEAHITVETVHGWVAEHLSTTVSGVWKTSQIARDPLLGDGKYFYLTAHDRDINVMMARIELMRNALLNRGVPVLREKIERIVYDVRYPGGASK